MLDTHPRKRQPTFRPTVPQLLKAVELRTAGLSYRGIAIAMRVFYGLEADERQWRHQLRYNGGMPPGHSRGFATSPWSR